MGWKLERIFWRHSFRVNRFLNGELDGVYHFAKDTLKGRLFYNSLNFFFFFGFSKYMLISFSWIFVYENMKLRINWNLDFCKIKCHLWLHSRRALHASICISRAQYHRAINSILVAININSEDAEELYMETEQISPWDSYRSQLIPLQLATRVARFNIHLTRTVSERSI